MPRIRTIKPEFWADEKLAPMDPLTRLVFIGLISMADDAGRLLDSVKQIDAMLFPLTDDTARESLANLSRAGRIVRGKTASGQPIIQIANWRHQKVDHPNLAAALPPITQQLTEDSREIREEVATDSRAIRDSISTSTYDQLSTTSERGAKPRRTRTPAAPREWPAWASTLADRWISRVGDTTPGKAHQHLARAVAAHGEAAVLRAMDAWISARVGSSSGSLKLAWFAEDVGVWVERSKPLVDPATGLLNERGMAALAGAR